MTDPLADLRLRLQELRSRAAEDEPSYQEIAKKAYMAKTRAYETINCSKGLPRWENVRLVVQVLNGDEAEFQELWRTARQAVEEQDLLEECRGGIDSPKEGTTVGRQIVVRGEVSNIPVHYHLWIAHRVDPDGLLWPKEPKVIPAENGSFEVHVYEAGSSPRVYVTLLAVPPTANAEFEKWIDEGKRTGHYPGIRPSSLLYREVARVCLQYDRSKP